MSKAYFIEGIPGSGKSTYAKRLYDYLVSQGNKVEMYSEGDLHPIDLAWCSILKIDKFNDLCEKYSDYREQILAHSKFMEDTAITAYTKIKVKDKDIALYDDFSPYEIYRSKDLEHFRTSHIKLWEKFNNSFKEDTIYVFECIYLQNHINELILKFDLNKKEMIQYFQDLIDSISNIDTQIIYIKPLNIKQTFDHIIKERKSTNPNFKDWIDLVIEYLEGTKYGKQLGYTGYGGAIEYFKARQNLECQILKTLRINKVIFEQTGDYNEVFHNIIKHIEAK